MKIKLTKNALRDEQKRVGQLQTYLPTLQLKKAMLQAEVNRCQGEIEEMQRGMGKRREKVDLFADMLIDRFGRNLSDLAQVLHIEKHYENIAGVEIPVLDKVIFRKADFFLFDSQAWVDSALEQLRDLVELNERLEVGLEKKRALEKDLRDVSIRVNLFEKVLIPRAQLCIKKIKIFLGDLELSAVSQAKVAKMKMTHKDYREGLA